MDSNKRIVVNTLAQYTRAVINACVSLFTMRIILNALGMADYGIYTIVAGVVALLGFITNALVITTQRYISFYMGKGELQYVKQVFSNSLFLHFVLAIIIGIIMLSLQPILFSGILNIDENRVDTAKVIYLFTVLMLMTVFITAPFKAEIIAHENIVYISIIEVGDALLRLSFSIVILFVKFSDTLLVYGILMFCTTLVNFMAYSLYSLIKFEECHIRGIIHDIDKSILCKFSEFASWTTYGMGCVVFRNQGFAVILNHFFGTVINAAYGIANQVYGFVAIISTSILNAMNPQIMKAEGNGNREKMLHLAEKESLYSEMLLMLVLIPFMFEMPSILHFWLGKDSSEMVMFTRFTLLALMIDQFTYGLNTANQAMGNIRNYTLLIYTPRILFLPIAYFMLKNGMPILNLMWLYVILSLCIASLRIPYIKYTAGLSIRKFLKNVTVPLIPLLLCQLLMGFVCIFMFDFKYRFILTIFLSVLIGCVVIYFAVLNSAERNVAHEIIRRVRTKIYGSNNKTLS